MSADGRFTTRLKQWKGFLINIAFDGERAGAYKLWSEKGRYECVAVD
jgi:hypothetical protein